MVQVIGNAVMGFAGNVEPVLDLPRPPARPAPHRPWCADCKRKHDASDLDTAGRCERCARAVASRAAAAERRRLEERAAASAEKPAVVKLERPARPTRRSTPVRRQPAPTAVRAPRMRPTSTRGVTVNEAAIVAEYVAGDTAPTVGARHGILPKRVRDILTRHHVHLRDDRGRASGSKPREYPAELIAAVHRLYVDEQLSRTQVAAQLQVPHKTVVTIMTRQGISARERQAGRQDGARHLKEQIVALGVSSRQIKDWALDAGVLGEIKVGIPSKDLVEAYARAHDGDA